MTAIRLVPNRAGKTSNGKYKQAHRLVCIHSAPPCVSICRDDRHTEKLVCSIMRQWTRLSAFMEWKHTFICRLHACHIVTNASACSVIVDVTQSLEVQLEDLVKKLRRDEKIILVRCFWRCDALCVSIHHQLEDFVGVLVIGGVRPAYGRGFLRLWVTSEFHWSLDCAQSSQAPRHPRHPRRFASSTAALAQLLSQNGCRCPS
jgi:hypothetical protein